MQTVVDAMVCFNLTCVMALAQQNILMAPHGKWEGQWENNDQLCMFGVRQQKWTKRFK